MPAGCGPACWRTCVVVGTDGAVRSCRLSESPPAPVAPAPAPTPHSLVVAEQNLPPRPAREVHEATRTGLNGSEHLRGFPWSLPGIALSLPGFALNLARR